MRCYVDRITLFVCHFFDNSLYEFTLRLAEFYLVTYLEIIALFKVHIFFFIVIAKY